MRTNSTHLLFGALALLQIPAVLPSANAADFTVPIVGRHRGVIVADYNGTPIYLHRGRRIVRDNYGVEQVVDTGEAYPVLNIVNPTTAAVPTRYLNGQPVR